MPTPYDPATPPDPQASRLETVLAATLYLMSHFVSQNQTSGCPRLALCVSRHLQCLALHPDAAPVIRDVCSAVHGAWSRAACDATSPESATLQ